MYKKIIAICFSWKALLLLFAFIATYFIPMRMQFTAHRIFSAHLPYFFWIWGNFDGVHYLDIASTGYELLQQPFFPLFPIAIYITHLIFHVPYIVSGQIVSLLSFVCSLFVIIQLLKLDKLFEKKYLIILIILSFPTAFFYSSVYNDSLFFLFANLTILYARKRKWILSSVIAGLATLTRLNGLALFFFILFEFLTTKNSFTDQWNIKKQYKQLCDMKTVKRFFKERLFFIVLIPACFVGYLLYVQYAFKDWTLVFSTMKIWGQDKLVLPPQVLWRYIKIVFFHPQFEITYFVALLEFASVLLYILLLIYSYKKIRLSYWIFFALSILIPSLTGTFQGMPRYGLHIYPMFLIIALFLQDKKMYVKCIYFLISLILLFICTAFFTRGYFIS